MHKDPQTANLGDFAQCFLDIFPEDILDHALAATEALSCIKTPPAHHSFIDAQEKAKCRTRPR